ncbi:MAG: hypothetical protein HKM07_03760 [Chlamydiae bacterium]|nr:hypothetical protein [Chlamydiota bacterium]
MKYSALAFSSLLLCSLGFADQPANAKNQGKKTELRKMSSPKTHSLVPCLVDETKWLVYGDFLYWEVREDQLQFAGDIVGGIGPFVNFVNNNNPGIPNKTLDQKIKVKESSFKWRPGFRVGTGVDLARSTWDIQLFWTRLHESTKAHLSDSANGILSTEFPLVTILSLTGNNSGSLPMFANNAKNKWTFRFDTIDLQVGKTFFPHKTVSVKPFFGVKAAQIDQRTRTKYEGLVGTGQDANNNNFSFPLVNTVDKKNNFHAIGPSLGVDSKWKFAHMFSLVTDFSFAAVYGKFNNEIHSQITAQGGGNTAMINIKLHNPTYRIRPTINGLVGFDFSSCLGKSGIISVGVAYEVQYFWNQWQSPSSVAVSLVNTSSSAQGDLMMHGLTAHLGFAF